MSDLADDSVGLLTWAGDPDRVIQDVEWKLEDRQDSTNRLEVTTSLAEAEGIQTEQELIFQNRRFIVDEVDRARAGDTAVIIADEAQAELAGFMIDEFDINAWTLEDALSRALEGTRWSMGDVAGTRYGRAQFEDISVLDVVKFLARHQDARVTFDSLRRRVNVLPEPGTVHDTVFTYGRQLTNIEKSEQAPTLTRLYGEGADGMTVASINDGLPYVEDLSYYVAQGISLEDAQLNYRKEERWEDSRYTVQANLLRDMRQRVRDESHPKITYTLTAATTHAIGADGETVTEVDDFGISDLALMDQVHVWDQETDTRIRAEVSAITTSSDASVNEVTLSYLPESLGASVEGRYFGDSGSPSRPGGSNWYQSPPQPRPSMPILESINELGVGTFRWNGQDENGSYETIPDPFGRVQLVGAVAVDGVVPSPESEDAFMGQWIELRGGGKATIAFGAPGQFAVWFYMVGHDARTRGPYSEPLVVEVDGLVDTEAIRERLDEAQERIDQAQRDLDEAVGRVEDLADQWGETDFPQLKADLEQAQQAVADAQQRLDTAEQEVAGVLDALEATEVRLDAAEQEVADSAQKITDAEARLDATEQAVTDSQSNIDQLRDVTLPGLEESLTNAVTAAEQAIQAFQQEWDESWDPEAMDELRDRQDTLEGDLITGLDNVYDQAQQLATAAENNAVGRAASDAQSEYDRLQEIAERALSRAGDNIIEDPSFETSHWPDEWDGVGGFSVFRSTANARTGDYQLRLQGQGQAEFPLETLDAEVGMSFRFGVYWATVSYGSSGNTAWLVMKDTDTGDDLAVSEPMGTSGYWSRLHVMVEVPEGVESVTPYVRVDHGTSATLILEDASLREVGAAAEALRAAEQARHEAQQAHEAAGNARDMAITAQDTAAGKADIIRSTTAPTGTAPEGSIWFRYNNMTASRRLIGWWVRESGAWRSQEMDETILPQVNIGTGTYGDLSGDRLEANTVQAGALAVIPDGRDLAPDLVDYADLWTLGSQVTISSSSNSESGLALRIPGDAGTTSGRAYGPWVPVRAGDTIYYKLTVSWYTRNPDGELRIYVMYNGSVTSWTRLHRATAANEYEGHFTIPRDGTTKVAFGVNIDAAGTNGGDWAVRDFDVRVAAKGVHITPQGIKAPQIDVQSLSGDTGFLNALEVDLLKGRLAVLDEAIIGNALLRDNAITAGKLAILPDAADFAPGPGGYEDLWTVGSNNAIVSASNDPSGAQLRVSPGSTVQATRTMGPRIRAKAGDKIYYRLYVGITNSPDAPLRVYFLFDDSVTSWLSVYNDTGSGWVEGVYEVRSDVERNVALGFSSAGGTQGNYWIRHMDVRKQTPGVLIEDGAITANHIVAESVAGAVAQFITLEAENVIATLLQASNAEFQDVAARVATLIELNASRITAGTISTARLNVSDLAAQIANIIQLNASRITAGTISASRLDISDLAARVATVISLNASRITAGQLSAARIDVESLFANSAFISNLAAEAVEAIRVTTRQIITGDIIATGTIDASHINVTQTLTAQIAQFLTVEAGHIAANAIDGMTISGGLLTGGEVRGGLISGTQITNGNGFSVDRFGNMEATGAQVDGQITARTGWIAGPFMVGNPNSAGGEGGIIPSDGNSRIRLVGRLPDAASANDTFTTGYTAYAHRTGSYGLTSVTYAVPAPYGTRVPMVTPNMDQTFDTARPGVTLVTRSRAAGSFMIIWAKLETFHPRPADPRMSWSYFSAWGVLIPS